MATISSTNILNALGAGSGIDAQSLATNLAEAEVAPRKEVINAKIAKTEARISGYGYIKSALAELKTAFAQLDDASDFSSLSASVSQPSALGVRTTSAAQAGSYAVQVNQLARPQRNTSQALPGSDSALNGGQPMTLSYSVNGGAAQTITVSTDTPAGVVTAINNANLGVKAQLLQTGASPNPYTIVLTGESGAAKNFSLTAPGGQIDFGTELQSAADALFTVNGLSIQRSSNQVSDLIEGVTLDFLATTASAARLDLTRDTNPVKEKIKGLVTAYNNLETTLKELGNPKSEVEDVGGVLTGDSILQTIRSQVRSYITSTSSTPGSTVRAARDAGLSFDRNGKLTLDETKLDGALQQSYDEVVRVFSAGTSNKSIYSPLPAGVAGDAVAKLDKLLRSTGLLSTQTENATQRIEDYQSELTRLEERMTQLLARYTRQFTDMESIVGNNNSLKSSLKSSFEGMMAMYTNK